MARKKLGGRNGYRLVPWLSARNDCKEKRFIQVGDTLLFDAAFQNLPAGAKFLYFCMAMESTGNKSFQFTRATAAKYGISNSVLRENIKRLRDAAFIQVTASGKSTRTASDYIFTSSWKTDTS